MQNKSFDIFTDIGQLKSNIIKEIDVINQRLVDEFAKLDNVHKAIEIEQKYLEEVYSIKDSTNTLAALLLAQEQERERFNSRITEEELAFTTEMSGRKAERAVVLKLVPEVGG